MRRKKETEMDFFTWLCLVIVSFVAGLATARLIWHGWYHNWFNPRLLQDRQTQVFHIPSTYTVDEESDDWLDDEEEDDDAGWLLG